MRVIEEPFTEQHRSCVADSNSGFASACFAKHERLVVLRDMAINQEIHAFDLIKVE